MHKNQYFNIYDSKKRTSKTIGQKKNPNFLQKKDGRLYQFFVRNTNISWKGGRSLMFWARWAARLRPLPACYQFLSFKFFHGEFSHESIIWNEELLQTFVLIFVWYATNSFFFIRSIFLKYLLFNKKNFSQVILVFLLALTISYKKVYQFFVFFLNSKRKLVTFLSRCTPIVRIILMTIVRLWLVPAISSKPAQICAKTCQMVC